MSAIGESWCIDKLESSSLPIEFQKVSLKDINILVKEEEANWDSYRKLQRGQ